MLHDSPRCRVPEGNACALARASLDTAECAEIAREFALFIDGATGSEEGFDGARDS